MKITLTPQTSPQRPGVVNILARFQVVGMSGVTGLTFQAAVPKVRSVLFCYILFFLSPYYLNLDFSFLTCFAEMITITIYTVTTVTNVTDVECGCEPWSGGDAADEGDCTCGGESFFFLSCSSRLIGLNATRTNFSRLM